MNVPSASFASLLVALDESPRAPLVFATATALARAAGAEVTLIRVLTEPADIPPAAHTDPITSPPTSSGSSAPNFRA